MALAWVAFDVAVLRARVLPQWTGFLLLGGVLLLAAGSAQPGPAQLVCAGIRDLAFGGMGLSLLTGTAHLHPGLWSLPIQAGGTGADLPPGGRLGLPRGDVARSWRRRLDTYAGSGEAVEVNVSDASQRALTAAVSEALRRDCGMVLQHTTEVGFGAYANHVLAGAEAYAQLRGVDPQRVARRVRLAPGL